MRAFYRIQQGLRALVAWVYPIDTTPAATYLTPDLLALFKQMRRSEQQHSLRVLRELLAHEHTHPDLLSAALLHDVGKICEPFSIPEKTLVVLVKALRPTLYQTWGTRWQPGTRAFWQRPFAVSIQHPAWGAELAQVAGASPLTVELIRRHADLMPHPPTTLSDQLLLALQASDDQN